MKLKAPVSSLKAAKIYSEIGVEEVYVGVKGIKEHDNRIITFNGRFNNANNSSIESFDELAEIVDYCHKNNMQVSFTANSRYLSENLHDYFMEYVNAALNCNVDAVIVGSIGSLMLLKDKLDVPIYSSTFFYPYNKYCVDFYHRMNVKRIVLSTAMTIGEIREIKNYIDQKKYDMELEVFAQFGCSNISGRCNVCGHTWNQAYARLCRGLYDVYDLKSGRKTESYPFLNAANSCSVCMLDSLLECDVTSLKFLGREMDIASITSMVHAYKTAVEEIKRGASAKEIRKDIINKMPWWEYAFCRQQQCLYKEEESARYNV